MQFRRSYWLRLVAAGVLLSATRLAADDSKSTSAPAQSLAAARALFLSGDYPAAAKMYDELVAGALDDKARLSAAVGRTSVDIQTGEYQKGIERLKALEAKGAADPNWHAALADLLEQIGQYDEAIVRDRRAIEIDKGNFRARWQLGRVLEMMGRIDEAVAALKPFNELMTEGSLPDTAEELTWVGAGFLRYSTLARHPELPNRTRHVLQNVYQEAFDNVDADYWPARLAAAQLLLEKNSTTEATADFKAILDKNANVADAHVALGTIALTEKWDFDAAEKAVTSAIKINPRHVDARLLQATARMVERRYGAAAAAAKRALAINPRNIEAMSLLAAAKLRSGDRAGCEALQKQVEAINPRPAVFHFTLGKWLVAGRQFAEGEQEFKKAMALAPHWSAPGAELGIMYLDIGEDELSRKTLEAAFDLDRFNRRTFQLIQLLDDLDKFKRLKTAHFIIKYEDETDFGFAARVGDVLEGMYDEVCRDFSWTPDKPTVVEIHPSHRSFSIRIIGRPFIATVGACTGRCIAFVQPRGRPPFGPFNWEDMLRHEFTHTVSMGVTGNRIPHWFTEGLAVHEEPHARPWSWKNALAQRVVDGELFTLRTIDWGFERARRSDDRMVAYAQSQWMVEYLGEKFGAKAVPDLLAAYRDGKTQDEAFIAVLKMTPVEFDAAFEKWAKAQVDGWRLYHTKTGSLESLRNGIDAHADDADYQAQFARALLMESEFDDAEAAAKRSLELNADQPDANEVLAIYYIGRMLNESDENERTEYLEKARPFIRKLEDLRPEHPLTMKFSGYLEQHDQEWREALSLYEEYEKRYPEDTEIYRRIAAIHRELKNEKAARAELEKLANVAVNDAPLRLEIAGLKWDDGDAAAARTWARRVLAIDPYSQQAYSLIGEASLKESDYPAAEEAFWVITHLAPKSTVGFDGLARVADAQGDKTKARKLRKQVRRILDPKGTDVGWGW